MAITKFQRWKTSEKTSDDNSKLEQHLEVTPIYENEPLSIRMLYDKVHELTDLINSHITDMAANNAKVGITNSQASAITANTAKTGITSGEQRDIANNKTRVASNATEITKLTKSKLSVSAMPLVQAGVEQAVGCAVVYDSKAKTYSMVFAYLETTTPKGGKATTVARTGSIQLK